MRRPSLLERITAFNQGRDPERLAYKYRAMARDPHGFLRGTCHLFYQDWPARSSLNRTPLAWICGDLHLENFGAYKGDNRLVYFDLNDFDEAVLAPVGWELARFLTSLKLAGQVLGLADGPVARLAEEFLDAYAGELREGKARWVERATARGMIRDLLKGLKDRTRRDLLKERTVHEEGRRLLRVDGSKAMPASRQQRRVATALVGRFAAGRPDPDFYRVLDVARRVAGIGSLGLERYVVLVAGRGGDDGHHLLDLKYQPGSSLVPHLAVTQRSWGSEAERTAALQRRGQAIAPAFLAAVRRGGRSYVLRELMPQQDRLQLEHWNGKLKRLETVVRTMGELVAWSHLRSAGRQGSAGADDWAAFAERRGWRKALLDYAGAYAERVHADWRVFRDSGAGQGEAPLSAQ